MSNIPTLYSHIDNEFTLNKNLLFQISTLLRNLVSKISLAAEQSTEGYCSRFTIPSSQVSSLYRLLNLIKSDVSDAFAKEWGHPTNAKMHSDPHYQVLLLLVYWGMKKDDLYMMQNALILVLIKLWNGRKQKYLKYCNPTTMNYVIENMLNKKHLAANQMYNTPFYLIKLHFVPTLLEKYKPRILQDSKDLKTLFEQGWRRIDQIFLQKEKKLNPLSGKVKPAGGLLLLYMKAQDEGLTLSSPAAMTGNDDDSDSEFGDEDRRSLTQIMENIFTETVNYDEEFLKELQHETKVASHIISRLLVLLHSSENKELTQKFCQMIMHRTGVENIKEILSPSFIELVEKKIVSSKLQEDVMEIKDLCDSFIKKVYYRKNEYRELSAYKRHQRRKVLIKGLVYDIRRLAREIDSGR